MTSLPSAQETRLMVPGTRLTRGQSSVLIVYSACSNVYENGAK